MPVSDDQKLAMWREVLALCRVKPGENIAVLTGETSLPQNIDMAMRAAVAAGAKVCRIDVPPGAAGGAFGQRADVGVTPLTESLIRRKKASTFDSVKALIYNDDSQKTPSEVQIQEIGARRQKEKVP